GGKKIDADAPIDRMPLYVRAGSILPLGPHIEYTDQDSTGPIELRVYKGADGKFDLYEDAGDGYAYERGQHSIIPMRWDDRSGVLTIGTREGTFPGMLEKRTFRIIVVGKSHGVGEGSPNAFDKEIAYNGKELSIKVPQTTEVQLRSEN